MYWLGRKRQQICNQVLRRNQINQELNMCAVLTSNMTSNMTSKSEVTIPAALRQSFGFKVGAAVEFFRAAGHGFFIPA